MLRILVLLILLIFSSCQTTYYVVRHAEKVDDSRDPDLSEKGKVRAENLKVVLQGKKIEAIYSSNFIRTKGTVQPLATAKGLTIALYNPADQMDFIEHLKASKKNTVIAGHSNTIRYIINGLAQQEYLSEDLKDQEY